MKRMLQNAEFSTGHCKQMSDSGETDSAFSDNSSLPSSESYTSMATVSSSTETTSSSSSSSSTTGGETCSITSAMSTTTVLNDEEQMQRIKAEKIRIALEKIKEAKIRKLFVRAFAKDGSSKSILVDEKMSVGEVCSLLADKHHRRRTHAMAVVEHMPELCMERILEDHDSLVETMVMWTRDSKNKVLFEERQEKYNLFFHPEKYLLSGPAGMVSRELGPAQKDRLIQDFFGGTGVAVTEVEGALYLKSDGKKSWKKYFFALRASGLYYNPKGKGSSSASKELVCLVQLELVEVYYGLGWKKKYHAPTDFCFALKHPQIQKKTSKYIRYFCTESSTALEQWMMGIRIAKLGKQMLHNFEHVHHEIATWDQVQNPPGPATPSYASSSSCSSSSAAATHSDFTYASPSRGGGAGGAGGSSSISGSGGGVGPVPHKGGVSHVHTSPAPDPGGEHYQALNPCSLQDSRMSVPDGVGSQHTVVKVHNSSSLVRSGGTAGGSLCYNPSEVVGMEVTTTTTTPPSSSSVPAGLSRHQRQGSEGGSDSGGGGGHKTPTKRVSFCATHSVISDPRELQQQQQQQQQQQHSGPRHRDSIISDSSEDSNSSGEGRHSSANLLRGKMRPKLPVTTETTRFLTEMNQLSIDSDGPGREGPGTEESSSSFSSSTGSSSSSSSASSRGGQAFSRLDRRRASMTERRGSDGKRVPPVRAHSISGGDNSRRPLRDGSPGPLSPSWRQSGTQRWLEDYHLAGGQEAMASLPEAAVQGSSGDVGDDGGGSCSGGGGDDDEESMYSSGGGSHHYQQIPERPVEPPQHREHQGEQRPHPATTPHPPPLQHHSSLEEKQYDHPQQYQLLQHSRQQQPSQQQQQQQQQLHYQQYHQRQQQQQQQQQQQSGIGKAQQYYHHPHQQQQHYHQPHSQTQQVLQQHRQRSQEEEPSPADPQHQQQHVHPEANSDLYATITSMRSIGSHPQEDAASDPDQGDTETPPEGEELPPPPPPLLLDSLAPLAPPPFHAPPKMCGPPATAPKPPSASPLSPTSMYKRPLPAHPKSAPTTPGCCSGQSPGPDSAGYPHGDRTFPMAASRSTPAHTRQTQTLSGPGKMGHPGQARCVGQGSEAGGQRPAYYVRSMSSPASVPQSLPVTCPVHEVLAEEPAGETGSPGYLKYGRTTVSSPPSQSSCLSSSAPPTLLKGGFAHPGYYMEEPRYRALQHPMALQVGGEVPGSPQRGSPHPHPMHLSTESPTLALAPGHNLRPSPSDSGYMEGDNVSTCSVSPCNPAYLHELPRRLRDPSPGGSPPRSCLQQDGEGLPAPHRRSASVGHTLPKGPARSDGGRRAPPPPPKRSETTRLSTELPKHLTSPPTASAPPSSSTLTKAVNPIYENCEGMMDISELPPPPPELLAGLPQSAATKMAAARTAGPAPGHRKGGGGGKQHKLPPPPPKRSKDTHLSQQPPAHGH
ncbi:uncharacterized protein LOC143293422 isoform X3 [Babylonia areolata]|uniref:uncharacterized protein LOC143293422 isoform X3 n=1 Tax=Babylonia areolata TaxID=304850 RepID=UPI003FD6353F